MAVTAPKEEDVVGEGTEMAAPRAHCDDNNVTMNDENDNKTSNNTMKKNDEQPEQESKLAAYSQVVSEIRHICNKDDNRNTVLCTDAIIDTDHASPAAAEATRKLSSGGTSGRSGSVEVKLNVETHAKTSNRQEQSPQEAQKQLQETQYREEEEGESTIPAATHHYHDSSATETENAANKDRYLISSKEQEQEKNEEEQRQQSDGDSGTATNNNFNTNTSLLDYARRGAVGAVGGAMTVVGLVMIPLPTPFGAVIASSGLAVLGTEFKGAKDLNDRLIEGAKQHVKSAREYMVQSIESMEDQFDTTDLDDDDHTSSEKTVSVTRGGSSISDAATASTADQDDDDDGTELADQQKEQPKWLHMNQTELERQERLARLKYERELKSNYQQMKEFLTKKTGLSTFLSKNVLPILKGSDGSGAKTSATEERQDGRQPVTVIAIDSNTTENGDDHSKIVHSPSSDA